FDQADLSFADLMLVIARAVVAALESEDLAVPATQSKLLELWFAEELLTETHRQEILGSIDTEAAATARVPFLAKLAAKITASLKTDNEYRREIRKRAERDPYDLIRHVNDLLDAASEALSQKFGVRRKIAVVVDNLEKLSDRRQVDAAVLRRA